MRSKIFLLLLFFLLWETETIYGKTDSKVNLYRNKRENSTDQNLPIFPDIVIVKRTGTSLMKGTEASWEKKLQKVGALLTKPMFPAHYGVGTEISKIFEIQLTPGSDVYDAATILSKDPSVVWAEPSYIRKIHYEPSDSGIGFQWYLDIVKASSAWDIFKGDTTIVIGIVDTGVNTAHPDLAANIWKNRGEVPNNGIDDDNNGYADDIHGWDFGNNDNDPSPSQTAITDDRWHGTGVAGVASAVTNNALGIASAAFNAKIMPIKTAKDDDEKQYISYGYKGIVYAADNGAHIINCSFGGAGVSHTEDEIIAYACSLGALVVASAGNEGSNLPQYPAGYSKVLSVAATNEIDKKASFSSYGYWVDVSAPGNQIYTTWGKNGYKTVSGTSFCSPLTVSVAALLKGFYPNKTGYQIGEQIRISTDPIDELNPIYSQQLGKGRLNAYQSLTVSSPSIRLTNINLSETETSNHDGIFDPGEEVSATFQIKNFLQPATGIFLSVQTTDQDLTIQNSGFNITSLTTFEEWGNDKNPVIIQISPTAIRGQTIYIILTISTNEGYKDFDHFTLEIPPAYATIHSGNVQLTLSSTGILGFVDYPDNTMGKGFIFGKKENLLFEGAVIAATSADSVSDVARGADESRQNQDFDTAPDGEIVIQKPGDLADEQGTAIFTDEKALNSLNLRIFQTSFAFSDSPNENDILLAYRINNLSQTHIKDLYFGIFTDWDVGNNGSNANENRPGYEANLSLGYVYDPNTLLHGGLQVVSQGGATAYKSISNPDEIYDGYTDTEKWSHLSSGIQPVGSTTQNDYSHILGVGPLTLDSEDTVLVGFAILGGADLDDLKANAEAARIKWQELFEGRPVDDPVISFHLYENFPNPFNNGTTIRYNLPEKTQVVLTIYDLMGRELVQLVDEVQDSGPHQVLWNGKRTEYLVASGVYLYRLRTEKFEDVRKMVLIH